MGKTAKQQEASRCLVAMSDWSLPASSVRRTLTEALRHGLNQLRNGRLSADQLFDQLPDVSPLSGAQQARLASEPDWDNASLALAAELHERWRETPDWQSFSAIVAPPGFGLPEQLSALARRLGWQVIAPPDDLRMTDSQARDWWSGVDFTQPWVIPELSHFWLRHRDGLALIRQLLDRLARGSVGAGVFGCNSWCWSFWSHCLDSLHFSVLTPPALDGEALAHWLPSLASGKSGAALQIRNTDTGHWVMPALAGAKHADRRDTAYLRDLAAMSRGIPAVALALWRRALRLAPEPESGQPDTDQAERLTDAGQGHCDGWVAPLDALTLPQLPPPSPSRAPMLLLHALLLHDGLGEGDLMLVTGLSCSDVSLSLNTLRRFELVTDCPRGWRVSPLAYPAVRRQLQSDGFPVDGF